MNLGIFYITDAGLKVAERISRALNVGHECFVKDLRATNIPLVVRKAFLDSDGLIFIMAAGIVVRSIAPLLKNKKIDPGVVVVDEKGRYAVSLVSGHLGGANRLAGIVSEVIGAEAVITTATDVNDLPCIEDISGRFNLAIEDIKGIKHINSAIVNGKRVVFVDEAENRLRDIADFIHQMSPERKDGPCWLFVSSPDEVKMDEGDVVVFITNRIVSLLAAGGCRYLILRPKDLVLGIGCDRGVSMKEVEDACRTALEQSGLSASSIRNLASIDIKAGETGILEFARKYGLGVEFYSKEDLSRMPIPSGTSEFVMRKVGVGGVCEPSALKSSGAKRLWRRKEKIGRVTVAIAEAPYTSSA